MLRAARAALAALLLTAALPAAAQPARPSPEELATLPRAQRVQRLRGLTWDVGAIRPLAPVVLDGALTEEDWARATPITDFYQGQSREGLPASERTAVRVLFTEKALYIGFRAWDSEPQKMKIRGRFRDEAGGADELVAIMLDAYHGHRTAIQFVTNANGLCEDLLQTGESTTTRNHDWDAIWNSSGRVLEDGYEVEVEIPFRSLRFEPPKGDDAIVFGIGFKRNIPRKNEEVTWPFVPNDSSWYRPSELGHLHGLDSLKPGRNLQLQPYVLGGGLRTYTDATPPSTLGRREVGLDAKWGVTTGLTADFTINTDFAQEEVDVQQVNLTRFSLFFPEKRQFFLEGQQAFRFGVSREADLIFTRRIGLSGAGEPIPILGGARLSGRQGRTTLGAMNLQVDDDGRSTPSQNYSVVRVKRDILSRSSVGAIFTDVEGGGAFNRVYGMDASFFVKRVWFFEGWAAGMDDATRGRDKAGYGRAAWETDRKAVSYTFLGIGERFTPGVGFIRRPNSLQHDAQARWSPRPNSDVIRQYQFIGRLGYITDTGYTPSTRERQFTARADLETGDAVQAVTTNYLENLTQPFRLRSNLTLDPGAYRFTDVALTFDSFRRRHLQLDGTFTKGGFYDGSRDALQLNFNWRFTRLMGVTATYTGNWVDLPKGTFTTHLVSSRILLALRNDLAVQTLLQYNDDTKQLSTNLRFNWIPKPGTDFFIVYNEVDTTALGWASPRNRTLTVKLNYLFQL